MLGIAKGFGAKGVDTGLRKAAENHPLTASVGVAGGAVLGSRMARTIVRSIIDQARKIMRGRHKWPYFE